MPCLLLLVLLALARSAPAQASEALPGAVCGELRTIEARAGAGMRYSFAAPDGATAPDAGLTVVLLIGGGGVIDLDQRGCPQRLYGNSLVRMSPLLRRAGVATVLADAPSDRQDGDGLGGFRIATDHADDLGKLIAELRARVGGAVWVIGHSRGTISAVNAAARLTGAAAADGVVLLSPMLVGDARARKAWAAQTVFSVDLEAIRAPLLAIGHASDNCPRSPAEFIGGIAARAHSLRPQLVTVSGGPGVAGRPPGLAGCEVGEPHDFVGQEAEVAAGILRFMRGGSY